MELMKDESRHNKTKGKGRIERVRERERDREKERERVKNGWRRKLDLKTHQ